MATTITKTLELTSSNASTYASGSNGCNVPQGDMFARQYLSSEHTGYATLKDAAKNVLYPTATAKPYKADSYMRASRNIGSTAKFALQFAGTDVHSVSTSSSSYNDYNSNNLTNSQITNSTRSTQIRYSLYISNSIYGARLLRAKITLYFYQYSCSAQKGNNADGVDSVSCSSTSPYQGDSVTWSCTLKNGAIWNGWYSDAACNNLVSSKQEYTESASDRILYAKATMPVIVSTNLYVKIGNTQNRVQKVYEKINGHWVEQTNIQSLFSTSYEYEKK